MKNSIKFIFLILLLALSGCATPLPVSQLTSGAENSRWVQGREYLSQTINGLTVTLSYYKNEGNLLVFDVLVDNASQRGIEVHSGQARIKSFDQNQLEIDSKNAIDPEDKLLEFDKTASRQQAQIANEAAANAVFATADLVATISDETNPNISKAEADARFNDRLLWSQDRQNDYDRQQAYLEKIKNTRLYWEEAPLRRTTVSHNEYINGRIFFERDVLATNYQISYSIPKIGDFVFNYEQRIIPVN